MRKKPKGKQTDPDFDTAAYANELTKTLMMEIFKIIRKEEDDYGAEHANRIAINFLASYVSTLVFNALKTGTSADNDEDRMALTATLFIHVKQDVEEAVEQAFGGAFQAFDPKSSPDYECTITCLDTGYETGQTH